MASYSEQVAEYQRLRREGYSGPQAAEMVWGPGGIQNLNQQRQKEAGRSGQMAAVGQVAGTLGGYYAANKGYEYLFPTKEAVADTATKAIPGTGYQTSGTLGITRAVPPPTTIVDGSQAGVLDLSGKTASINTPSGAQEVPVEALNDPGFLSSVNWGNVAQGATGVLQLAQAYKMYKSGDKGGAGLIGATGAANLAAAGAFGTAASTGATTALGGNLIPGLNLAAGLYGGYKTAQMLSDAPGGSQRTKQGALGGAGSGAALGTAILGPGLGTAIGATIGATIGAIGSWTGAKKGKAQVMRDGIRKVMQEGGILDQNWQGTLADGSKYDFGKDGSTMKWKAIDEVAAANPNAWSPAVNLADALSAGYGFVGQKASDIAAWYAKAAVSNAGDDAEKAKANVRHFAAQQGMTFDLIKSKLDEAKADNRVSEDQYNRYLAGATDLFTGQATPGVTTPGSPQINVPRPKKGEVARLSPGMYRTDKGGTVRAPTMREALQTAYNKTKTSKEL